MDTLNFWLKTTDPQKIKLSNEKQLNKKYNWVLNVTFDLKFFADQSEKILLE